MIVNGFKIGVICFMLMGVETEICLAQKGRGSEEKIISDLMERLIENNEATVDYTDLQEQYEYFIKHKIDLNKADRFQLEQLLLLNDIAINAIINHRLKFGDYMSVYELQTIDVLDERTIYYLSYFVRVDDDLHQDHTPFFKRIQKGKHEILTLQDHDFQTRVGYYPNLKEQGKSYYEGSPYRYVLRYRFNYTNKLSFGYTAEKDMGEPFLQNSKGFDFNSVHFLMRDKGKWKAIALGDYQVSFGQGLTFGSGMASRKSAYVLNVRRSFQTVRPYRSLNENEFLRGAAATYSFKKWEVTAFGSHKYISTNYQYAKDTLSNDDGVFSSIQLTGLHRTPTEIGNKNNVKQTLFGSHLGYKNERAEIGLTAAGVKYDKQFLPGTSPYQLYNFSGNKLYNVGLDYGFQLYNTNFFGEVSYSSNQALAGIFGLNTALHQNIDMVLLYRNFSKNYQTIFNNPFAENSDGRNEEGFYTGISIKLARKWQLNLYMDVYRSPWLRYLVDAPQFGTDYLVELQFNPSKRAQFYIRYRNEEKNKNQSDNLTPTDFTSNNQRQQYRFHAQYTLTETWSGKSRLESIQFNDELNTNQLGTLIFQDLSYTSPKKKISITMRIAAFSVDDYNARVYATENEVLYQYAVPLYQNSGMRYYAVIHYRLNRKLDLWLKCSQTAYSNMSSISSGLEKVNGNTLSDLRVQVRITL
jgi:hypothetical protein